MIAPKALDNFMLLDKSVNKKKIISQIVAVKGNYVTGSYLFLFNGTKNIIVVLND